MVFFHFGFSLVSGGFVGVDVFFVISGYLITGIIAAELATGHFSILGFYERRVKRIIPALALVVAVTALGATLLLTPRDMARFASEVSWSSFFSSNFLFFRKDGYFDGASTMRLLLHTWSLSVEEQYYIVVPLLLLAGWRSFRGHLAGLLLALGVLSLALSIYGVVRHPSATFYLLPARAWELLCGSLLALAPTWRCRRGLREAAGLAGLTAIAVAVLSYDSDTAFPGAAALLPCLGATALLWAGEGSGTSVAGSLLRSAPMVAVGRISYSLYLWHWPILVLAKYYLLRDPNSVESLALIALSVALAVATYFLVEQPFRRMRVLRSRRSLFVGAGCVLVAMALFGVVGKSGFPGRFDEEARRLAAASNSRDRAHDACMDVPADKVRRGEVCGIGRPHDGRPDFVVWGDSHSGALMPAFRAVADKHGLWGLHIGFSSCAPLLGIVVRRPDSVETLQCPAISEAAVDLMAERGVRTVVMAARWPMYSEGWPRFGVDARNKPLSIVDVQAPTDDPERHAVFERGLERTVARLRALGMRVVVLEPLPEAVVDVPMALAVGRMLGRDVESFGPLTEQVLARQDWVRGRLERLQQGGQIVLVRFHDLMCGPERCPVEADGQVLYRDVDHMTIAGALRLAPRIESALVAE